MVLHYPYPLLEIHLVFTLDFLFFVTIERLRMPDVFAFYEGELKDFVAEALITKDTLLKRIISTATKTLVDDLSDMGIVIDETYQHTLDNSAVRHVIKTYGSPKEVLRGQIPITDLDLMLIPVIVSAYDSISTEKNRRGQDVIIYTKTMEDGVTFCVEEIRLGRHELAASTMYKKKKG